MLTDDDLAEIEGDAEEIYRLANEDTDAPPSMSLLCRRTVGCVPIRLHVAGVLASHGSLNGRPRVTYDPALDARRASEKIGHEIAEWWLKKHDRLGPSNHRNEALCDALGAMLVLPRRAFRRALRTIGHRVKTLAGSFRVTESLTLLRVGEVSRRSVVLLREPRIERGDPFVWGPAPLKLPRAVAHPIRVDGRWGAMAA